jgi:hypothetical protein
MLLRVAESAEIILSSIWAVKLESMGRSSFVDGLLRYGRNNAIGIFRKFPLTFHWLAERSLWDQFYREGVIEMHGYPNKLLR